MVAASVDAVVDADFAVDIDIAAAVKASNAVVRDVAEAEV